MVVSCDLRRIWSHIYIRTTGSLNLMTFIDTLLFSHLMAILLLLLLLLSLGKKERKREETIILYVTRIRKRYLEIIN